MNAKNKNVLREDEFYDGESIRYIIYEAPKFVHFFHFLNGNDSRLKYFNEGTVRNIARQVLSALSHLHDQNMLHNNISPLSIGIGNVFRVEKTLKFDIKLVGLVSASTTNPQRKYTLSATKSVRGQK